MNKQSKGTVLITGASSGIGLELARVFARHGYALVITARGETRLQELAQELRLKHNAAVRVLVADLALPAAPQKVFEELQRDGIAIDVLVNNAGFATFGEFSQTDIDAGLQLLQVNISALTHLTKLFLPQVMQRRGKILNVASTAAFAPGPLMAVYYASKT